MKTALLILIFALAGGLARAQQTAATAQDGATRFESVDDWLQQNIDPDVLNVFQKLDQERLQKLFSELQQAMNGTNIQQLGTLHATVKELIPVLQKYDQTAAYGDWLQMRLDDLEAADEMERALPQPAPGAITQTSPSQKLARKIWAQRMDKRPWPAQAKNYVPEFKRVFASERVPPELVWVAEVESSFNAGARSPAGAAGMFQLMPQTARDEQLSLFPFDERYQPEKSARAAARYLRALHNHYGDWELALAAYNAGEGRVDKLLKQENARTFEAIARRLPAETQLYVPKVEATVQKREGRELEGLKAPKA